MPRDDAVIPDGVHRPYVVVYDGDCGVCSRFVARLARWDTNQQFEIVPSQAPSVRTRFPWISDDAYRRSVQLIRLADGQTWEGAAAIRVITRHAPAVRWTSWLFALPGAEWAYRWFARNRYRIGSAPSCPRP
jgi:predicted DCC family thiol-disulfide oxidoreductase YuxK